MSGIEGMSGKAMRRLVAYRVAGAGAELVSELFKSMAKVPGALSDFSAEVGSSIFSLEVEEARRYYTLTGMDPAKCDGDDVRYREVRVLAGDEEELESLFVEDDDDD